MRLKTHDPALFEAVGLAEVEAAVADEPPAAVVVAPAVEEGAELEDVDVEAGAVKLATSRVPQ